MRSPSSPAPAAQPAVSKEWKIQHGVNPGIGVVCVFGCGGSGKSSLVANAAKAGLRPFIADVENGARYLDVPKVSGITSFTELRSLLQDHALLSEFDLICVDSLTTAQELCAKHVLDTIPKTDQGAKATSIENYGYGKGLVYVYEQFLLLLSDLDALRRAGKSIVTICHDCTANVPNPAGDNWIRYEPRLQSPASGNASIRLRVREWCDHLLFIGYDVAVEDGKGRGAGTRCIYPQEMPTHMAKSRALEHPIPYERGSCDLWNLLLGKGA